EQLMTDDAKLRESLAALHERMRVPGDGRFLLALLTETGEYQPQRAGSRMSQFGEVEYQTLEALWWRKEDSPARSPKSLSEPGVREKVIRAGKMDRAQALARDEAQKLVEEINKAKVGAEDAKKLLNEQRARLKLGESFELDEVSRLVSSTRTQES